MNITIELDTSVDPRHRDADDASVAHAVAVLMESLIAIDSAWLARNGLVPLYSSGVTYCCDGGKERFADIGRVLNRGGGDCAELSAWRIAELRLMGENAQSVIEISKGETDTLYHVMVLRGDGSIEDPSVALGME